MLLLGREWIEDIAKELGVCVEQVDRPRVEQAFLNLKRTCEWWPSLAEFYKALPMRSSKQIQQVEQMLLPQDTVVDNPKVARENLDRVAAIIGGIDMGMPPE